MKRPKVYNAKTGKVVASLGSALNPSFDDYRQASLFHPETGPIIAHVDYGNRGILIYQESGVILIVWLSYYLKKSSFMSISK